MNRAVQIDDSTRWNRAIWEACGAFTTQLRPEHSLFIGEMDQHDVGGFSFAELRTNAGRISKGLQSIDNADDRFCFLLLQRKGSCHLQLNGQSVDLMPGELALMDQAGECLIEPRGLIEHVSISISRERVQSMIQDRPLSGKLRTESAGGRLLRSLVFQIMKDHREGYLGEEGSRVQDALIALLLPALNGRAEVGELGQVMGGTSLRRQIESLVMEHLQRQDMTPEWMAARLGVSVRHLYRAFEHSDESLSRYVQLARLERCANDLSNPCLGDQSITDIAYSWGFSDFAHFSKIFKRQYQQSPRDFRAENAFAKGPSRCD